MTRLCLALSFDSMYVRDVNESVWILVVWVIRRVAGVSRSPMFRGQCVLSKRLDLLTVLHCADISEDENRLQQRCENFSFGKYRFILLYSIWILYSLRTCLILLLVNRRSLAVRLFRYGNQLVGYCAAWFVADVAVQVIGPKTLWRNVSDKPMYAVQKPRGAEQVRCFERVVNPSQGLPIPSSVARRST